MKERDNARGKRVLAVLNKPMRMVEIHRAIGGELARVRDTVYNLVARGKVINIARLEGRNPREPGVFLREGLRIPAPGEVADMLPDRSDRGATCDIDRWTVGADLAAAWGIGRRPEGRAP